MRKQVRRQVTGDWRLAAAAWLASVLCAAAAEVSFEWDPSPDGSVIGYRLYWQTNAPGGTWGTNWASVRSEGTNCTATVSNLVPGMTVRARATAFNALLESEPSGTIDYLLPLPPPAMLRLRPKVQTAAVLDGGLWQDLAELPPVDVPVVEGQAFYRVRMEVER